MRSISPRRVKKPNRSITFRFISIEALFSFFFFFPPPVHEKLHLDIFIDRRLGRKIVARSIAIFRRATMGNIRWLRAHAHSEEESKSNRVE